MSDDGHVRRAEMLADLGRYDEAADELTDGSGGRPGDPTTLTVLARVHLAAERPAEALAAADAALAAAPGLPGALVARGMALVDLRRFGEAAQVADEILARAPDDAYAHRSAAAILAGSRNGQKSINAAWRGAELAPEEPQAHLVLALVAARLQLFDLAERAYQEALRLDPSLADAREDTGVIRLERKRYALALEELADRVDLTPVAEPQPVKRTVGETVRQLVVYGAGYTIVGAVLVAFMAAANEPISRFMAGFAGVVGFVVVGVMAARVPGAIGRMLSELLRTDRLMALAVYASIAGPFLVLLYAAVGTPWPLVLAIVATAVAQLAVFRTRQP
ncbi:tetratricopeptide repeat protein [Polymorphospora lycopeni]|uniref:Tetratricopeptide repeat protein n=1 Tax=Polymorphospora lycopeni TaxID=3140240 RepID=A0ABV5CZ17_9ACTN